MKSLKFARLAAIAAVASLSSAAFAADSATLNVSATVSGVCKLTSSTGGAFTGPLTMGFGALDPSVGSAGSATTTVYYKCTNGTTGVNIKIGNSTSTAATAGGTPYAGTLTGPSSSTIPYSISWTNPTVNGAGFSAASQTVVLTGAITAGAYSAAVAGSYADTANVFLAP